MVGETAGYKAGKYCFVLQLHFKYIELPSSCYREPHPLPDIYHWSVYMKDKKAIISPYSHIIIEIIKCNINMKGLDMSDKKLIL